MHSAGRRRDTSHGLAASVHQDRIERFIRALVFRKDWGWLKAVRFGKMRGKMGLRLAWTYSWHGSIFWRTRYHKLPPASVAQDWTHEVTALNTSADHLQVAGWLFLPCSTFASFD